MRIGNFALKTPFALAPMAGYTDYAFRKLCLGFGAGYTVTEMVSAKALTYQDKKSQTLLKLSGNEHPAAVQIFGSELTSMQKGAEKALTLSGADILDINMGCPTPKIVSGGDGSALMLDPSKAAVILGAVVKTVYPAPVTVKTRLGYARDSFTCIEFAKACEAAGAAALCIHGRTKEQQYYGTADLEKVALVKKDVKIPVFANGDITTAEGALAALRETGCDGVMIGRGALGNPFIFEDIQLLLTGNVPKIRTRTERLSALRTQVLDMISDKGEVGALLEARKHIVLYLSGFQGAAAFRRRAGELSSLQELDALIEEIEETTPQ